MDVKELKHAIKHCAENHCIGCRYRDDLQCVNHIMGAAESYIAELEERLAIMQESMEALEKRCNAFDALEQRCKELEALEKQLDDSDRINVVRCSECQYWNPPTYAEQEDGSTVGHCTAALNGQQTDAYWFCADGTR